MWCTEHTGGGGAKGVYLGMRYCYVVILKYVSVYVKIVNNVPNLNRVPCSRVMMAPAINNIISLSLSPLFSAL